MVERASFDNLVGTAVGRYRLEHLANLGGSLGSHWENVAPAALVSIIIPLIVFFSLQRYFVRGLLAGSVKS